MTGERPRLSEATLEALPAEVERPGYVRRGLATGVVHLGLGAFHRAHQAVAFDDIIRRGDWRWGVRGVSLRSPAVRDAMQPQDSLYGVVVRDGADQRVRVIGSVRGVMVAPEDPAAVIAALAAPETHLATLTITEKGYNLDPASGVLNADDPEVVADLAAPQAPRTAAGLLVAALAVRRARGLPALTAISCDNLPENGHRLRQAVIGMARRRDPALADWIADHATFPQTMVDRIVPATTEADLAALAERLGVVDRAAVKTEPFSQWVIENRFAGERPELESVGVRVVASVAPWETAKLRLLNGAHTAIAYLGGLAGVEFVHEFIARPAGAAFIRRLWGEAETTLAPTPDLDIPAYGDALMARFANPALQHRARQIAQDGSQKIPPRLLAPIAHRLQRGLPIEALSLVVAAWMRWQEGRDEAGGAYVVDDPLAAVAARLVAGARGPVERVDALLSLEGVFPTALARDARFADAVRRQALVLAERGAFGAIEAVLAARPGARL